MKATAIRDSISVEHNGNTYIYRNGEVGSEVNNGKGVHFRALRPGPLRKKIIACARRAEKKEKPTLATETKFPIETGIPIPPKKTMSKYPFDLLEVGQSFFVPKIKNVSTTKAGAHLKRTFVQRQMDGGVRVWRTK